MPHESPGFTAWIDELFRSYYDQRPVNATFVGVHDRDHRLPDFSENGAGDARAAMEGLLRRSADLDRTALGDTGCLDLDLARGFLRIALWEEASAHFHRGNPSLYTGEAVFGVMSLFLTPFAPLGERAEAAVQRMEGIPRLLEEGRRNVRTAPALWTERAIRECDGALAFFGQGTALLAAEEGIAVRGFDTAAERAARAFAAFREHLDRELRHRPSDAYACGDEALALHLREGHFLSDDANEVARYAEAELAEARAHLAAHARDFGASSPEQALAGLDALHPPAELYYGRYQEVWDEARGVAEAQRLVTWPDAPIRYVPRPAWARAAAPYLYFLFYRSPAAFGGPAVHDYLVAPLPDAASADERERFLRANNDSAIKLNHVVHHGGLGHQVQNAYARRAESRIGRVAAADCASRIALLCGGTMAEGWACYATDLMAEAGFLTPLERYAEWHTRTRMCARAVVDVRLHQGRFGLQAAADYYREHAGMSPEAALGEAVKNSMFPGAAVMYVVGTDGLHALRREMARREGAVFDLRAFHDTVLSYGSVPVAAIAAAMTRGSAGARDDRASNAR
jgi:hypothetical protein